jgi:hypothetical protein
MYDENGVLVDVGQVHKLIESAGVLAVGFERFTDRLIVDTRTSAEHGPLVEVAPPAANAQERLLWLAKKRPRLEAPDSFMYFSWPHSIDFLVESAVWADIRRRVGADHDADADRQCQAALAELKRQEREAIAAAITGEGYFTFYPRE